MDLGNLGEQYVLTSLATLLSALAIFFGMANVGKNRAKHGVQAPSVDGPEEFQRAFRAHMNTVEQAIMFLPCMWVLASFTGDQWAGIIGIVWAVSRILYIVTYSKDASKRGIWFMIGFLAFAATFLWGLGIVLMKLLGI